jgi:hypothetical protein
MFSPELLARGRPTSFPTSIYQVEESRASLPVVVACGQDEMVLWVSRRRRPSTATAGG